MARKASTAWGEAAILDQVTVPQRAGAKRFAAVVQLLAGESGEQLVRIAYTTDGATRRGPVTLRARDVARLRGLLGEHEELGRALGCVEGGGRGKAAA
jgi:hypothetical protein